MKVYRFLTGLRAKKKMKHVRRTSQPQTAEGKALRCQPDELPGAPGQVHVEAVVVSCRDTRRHTCTHAHMHARTHAHTRTHTHTPRREVTRHTSGVDSFP